MLIDDARQLLSVWRERLVSDEIVVAWADAAIESLAAEDLPAWLHDLSLRGPAKCMAGPSSDFIDVPDLSFQFEFAVRAEVLDRDGYAHIPAFVHWISRACIGQDLSIPEVYFGHSIDDVWTGNDRTELAEELVRRGLPRLLASLAPLPEVLRHAVFGRLRAPARGQRC